MVKGIQFKIGDIVKVLDYDSSWRKMQPNFVSEMFKFQGRTYTVNYIDSKYGHIRLRGAGGDNVERWIWNPAMLKLVQATPTINHLTDEDFKI